MKIVALIVAAFVALAGASCPNAGYSAPGYPAPACPTNYLFSCQPNLATVPCAQEAPAYGSAGAYTEQVPFYLGKPNQEQHQRYHQRIGMAALMEELRGLGQGFQGQQF
ncbi:vitelline membrane protein Vm32E [Drosophila subpulchrella]|uniref:vitelline membrane protein Vm32E n=1 Tax=Drosophila subpulchrella TaxID=1486046 RepID=UPI0018A193BF|nr:vitelline membrane protein Vm32E [Drosophila subpulchrella]